MLCKLYFLLCCVWSCNNKWLKTFPFHILSVHPTTISLSAFFSAPFISPSFATSNIQRCSPSDRARTTNLQSMRSACSHYATLPVLMNRQNAINVINAQQHTWLKKMKGFTIYYHDNLNSIFLSYFPPLPTFYLILKFSGRLDGSFIGFWRTFTSFRPDFCKLHLHILWNISHFGNYGWIYGTCIGFNIGSL